MVFMLPPYFIYCHWVWLWTILFSINLVKYSPLPSAIGALLYGIKCLIQNIDNQIFKYKFIFTALFCDISILSILLYKLKNPAKSFVDDLIINIIVFIVYLLFLYFNNETFATIYYDKIPNQEALKGSLGKYIFKRLTYYFPI